MIDNFVKAMKAIGVLYVDIYPCRIDKHGEIQFLLFKRRDDVVMPNIWQAISGKIQENEKISAAFIRQIKKKTGNLPARIFKLDFVNTFYDEHYDTVMLVPSAGCVIDSEIRLDTSLHTEYRFVSPSELAEFIDFPNQLHAFELARSYLQKYPNGHSTKELPREDDSSIS